MKNSRNFLIAFAVCALCVLVAFLLKPKKKNDNVRPAGALPPITLPTLPSEFEVSKQSTNVLAGSDVQTQDKHASIGKFDFLAIINRAREGKSTSRELYVAYVAVNDCQKLVREYGSLPSGLTRVLSELTGENELKEKKYWLLSAGLANALN
jgi:hypothetical protein